MTNPPAARPRPVMLIIRDGWGLNPSPPERAAAEGNATLLARTPVQQKLLAECPWALLTTSGEAVGLPAGQMGNSEVGHQNLGAGRIVYQDLTRINRAIADGSFFERPALLDAVAHVRRKGSRLHLMGLCSDGGVHSHLDHLVALLELARRSGLTNALMHCFTDGRDTSPTSGAEHLAELQRQSARLGVGRIVSIVGRYYAMDRDRRWDRVAKAYNLLVHGEGELRFDPVEAMRRWYAEGKTDEFIPPTAVRREGESRGDDVLADDDAVVFFNFRYDRARQLTQALCLADFSGFDRGRPPPLHYVCMTNYDKSFRFPEVFPPQKWTNTLADVLSARGLRQLRIAETEKHPHVTRFFNVDPEKQSPVPGEDRYEAPSPRDVATYDLKPEMSAYPLTEELIRRLRSGVYDVVILNYANPDMVGHTGNIAAAVRAVEVVDECVGKVLQVLQEVGGAALITADHGNAERMLTDDGKPHTAHTTYPVQIFYFGPDAEIWRLRNGILADVAPTMLTLLGIEAPGEMTGRSLLAPKGAVPPV